MGRHKGSRQTEQTKKKISNTLKDRFKDPDYVHPNKGKKRAPFTDLTKQRISKNTIGKKRGPLSQEQKDKLSKKLKGIPKPPRTQEHKDKIRRGVLKYLSENRYNLRKPTGPEIKTKEVLERCNIKFKEQFVIKDRLYDFYLPDYNLLIEIDGIYWHSKNVLQKNMTRIQKQIKIIDIYKNKLATEQGYTLVRFWEDELDKLENYLKRKIYNNQKNIT